MVRFEGDTDIMALTTVVMYTQTAVNPQLHEAHTWCMDQHTDLKLKTFVLV